MEIQETELPGVLRLTPRRFQDDRGFFAEVWNRRAWATHGVPEDFVQDNQSVSHPPGTVRGLHFQAPPHAQGKLVRVGRGAILDVAVDIRRGSPTFAQWIGVEMSAADGTQLWIPPGFLHGFVTREPDTEVLYKCTDYYAPETEGSVRWDDPDLGIEWGVSAEDALLSPKDAAAPGFRAFETPFVDGAGS